MHISTQLSRQYGIEMAKNRSMLLKFLSCIKFLARQGLPFRGHNDDSDSNLIQLLMLKRIESSLSGYKERQISIHHLKFNKDDGYFYHEKNS